MGVSGALLAMSAVSAIDSIGQGYVQKAEADYAATIAEGQAQAIDFSKDVEYGQFQRLKGQQLSTSIANIGASGIGLGGSALATVLDAQTQIDIDQSIGQFNLEQERMFRINESSAFRREGKAARRAGYTNAFSQILMGGSQFAERQGFFDQKKINVDKGAKKSGKL